MQAEDVLYVKQITQKDDRHLSIVWSDAHNSLFDVVELRRLCPCALCVDEKTGKRMLKAEDIAEQVRPVEIHSVGRYALTIYYSDGHRTGIYPFKMLRTLK